MTVFESLHNTTDKAADNAEKYLKTSQEYFKLKVFQQLAITTSMFAKFAIIGGLLGLGLIFLSVAGAIAIGEALGNVAIGYVIVSLVFFLLAVIAYKLKKKFDLQIIKLLSDKFFDKK